MFSRASTPSENRVCLEKRFWEVFGELETGLGKGLGRKIPTIYLGVITIKSLTDVNNGPEAAKLNYVTNCTPLHLERPETDQGLHVALICWQQRCHISPKSIEKKLLSML